MDKQHLLNCCSLCVRKIIVLTLVFVMLFSDVQALLNIPFLTNLSVAEAATGDFATYLESGGAEVVDSTGVVFDVTWDTTLDSNSNIALQGDTSNIDLSDGGKYLVLYNTWAYEGTAGGANRRSLNSFLTVAGNPIAYGRGGGYIRDSEGFTTAYVNGAAIINATAGDDLQVHLQRDDGNSGAGAETVPGTNGISVLKLPDGNDYLRARITATSSDISGDTSFTDVQWDTADEVDTDSFSFSPTSGNITLKGDDGDYFLVTANVGLYNSANNTTRLNYEMRLTLDGVEIPGTVVTSYLRGSNDTWRGQLVYSGLIAKDAVGDQTLSVEMRRESSGGATTVIPGNISGLTIMSVPSSAEVIRLTDNSGTQTTSNASQALTFDTDEEINTTKFSHSTTTDSNRVNIDSNDDYLFFATAFTNTISSDNNREPFRVDWNVSGVPLTRGSFGAFNRSNSTFSAGASGGVILQGLTSSDYVAMSHIDETNNTPDDSTFAAGRVALQGIALNENFYGLDTLVTASGTHELSAEIPTVDLYTGGQFIVQENSASRNVTNVTIAESGTVDASAGLSNVELWYDLSTISPYDCSEESFDGDETQFGSTDTNGFSGADGSSSFNDSVSISPTQTLCLYPVMDVTTSAVDGETISVSINNPVTDVVVTGGASLGPSSEQALAGSVTLQSLNYTQIHYHWRNDDGSESGASSATAGTEDTPLGAVSIGAPKRLRMEVSHEGSLSVPLQVTTLDDFSVGTTKTISDGSNRLLVVGIHSEDSASNVNVSSATYGGQTLTEVRDEQVTTVASNGMWVGYLTESQIQAASGNTISASWVGGIPDTSRLYSSVVYENVDQTNPISGWSSNTATAASTVQPTSTIPVQAGDRTAYFTVTGETSQTHTPASGYSEGTEEDNGLTAAANASKVITANGTEQPTASWTATNNRLAIVALTVNFINQRDGLLQYKLQYGVKESTCSAISSWTDVAEDGGHWDAADSSNLTFGEDTSNIAEGIGGVTNEGTTFVGSNGVVDTGDKSLSSILNSGEYAELEYTVVPTINAVEGNTYCFRTVDGAPDVTHSYRIPLTIQSSQVDATLTDFPVYVNLADLGSHFFNNVASDGSDIRVTESDGLTETSREIVSISTGGKTGEMHFKAPTISATVDTTFYIYYGGSVGQYQASSTYGTNSAWNSNYEAVYHLAESGSTYLDSTINSNDGIGEDTDPTLTTGKLGSGQDVSAGHIDIGNGMNANIITAGEYLVSTWLNLDSSATDQSPVSQYTGAGDFLLWADAGDGGTGFCHYNGTYMPSDCRDLSIQTIGLWQHLVARYDGSNGYVYLNGVNTGAGATASTFGVDPAINFSIGSQNGDSTLRQLDGQIDEVRITSFDFGPDWISAEFRNQSTSTDFYATSTEETMLRSPIDVIYDVYPEATINADVIVSATSTQVSSLNVGSTDNYIGGGFVIQANTGTPNVTSITITENGSVNASTSLDNIKLFYELDTSGADGYDCSSESYAGTELPFGVTDTDGFSSPNGTSTFTDSVGISTTQSMCVYVVLDVNTNANNGETIDIEISTPNSEVVISTGSVAPGSTVGITGSTTVAGPVLTQTHYHWRSDNGDESDSPSGASSASGDVEDTPILSVPKESTRRLRLQVSNEGSVSMPATNYRLEYGTKITTCDAVGSWIDVGAVGGAWDMALSPNITDGNTTDISTATSGAMTNENSNFVGTGALRETTSDSGSIALSATQFTELEYSIAATADSGYDTDYCFRVTDTGTDLDAYSVYAELTTREKQDFYIQRGVAQISGTSQTFTAGADYEAPSATSTAFVRISNSRHTGAGNNTGGNNTDADDFTAYISDQSDITSGFTISRPASASSDTRVYWEIIEFIGIATTDNEMIVRDVGELSLSASNLTATSTAVNGVVDDADVVVFITGQYNDDAGRTNVNDGLFTASWNSTTSQAVFTRAEADVSVGVSYAVVEFVGANWGVERIEHVYSAAGGAETETITAIPNVGQAFVHAQKRVGAGDNGLDEAGHQVWVSSLGAVSFQLKSGATTPASHLSVAWVISNTQTGDGALANHHSSGIIASGGSEPNYVSIGIGATVNPANSSIFATNDSAGSGTAYPRGFNGYTLISETNYELFQSDTGQNNDYSVDVVEWPVADTSIRQNYYRFYVDEGVLYPTDAWPVGATDLGENTSITASDDPLGEGERVRIRMSLRINNATLPESVIAFKLQYGLRDTSCSAISIWNDIGDPGDGTIWRGYDGAVVDGTALATSTPAPGTLNLSLSDVAGTYEEQNNTAVNPFSVDLGEDVEYDWLIEHNGAAQRSDYCFRMVESDGTELDSYNNYPTLRTTGYTPIVGDWRWYEDETNETPTTPLASENTAPTDISNQNIVKLRVLSSEVENAAGTNLKFALQYSQYPDFSDGGTFLVSTSSCNATSTWCYADGAGVDNVIISSATLSSADSCIAGTGDGCGSHNEAATTTSSLGQAAGSNMELEFTLKHAAARANGVYYFRLYDAVNDEPLVASSSYPSLVTEGAQLVFTMAGLPSSISTEGITTDITSDAGSILFSTLPFDTEYEAAHRLTVNTNATEGYQILMYSDQFLQNSYGTPFGSVAGSNASPASWSTGCSGLSSCFGYHVGDDLLAGGSARFGADDSYAAFSTTTPEEVAYSSIPANESHDIVYKIQVGEGQPAGDYETSVTFIAIPVF